MDALCSLKSNPWYIFFCKYVNVIIAQILACLAML